jgi:hypothetical protein
MISYMFTKPMKYTNARSFAAKKAPSRKRQTILSEDESEVEQDTHDFKRRRVDSEADDDGVNERDPMELDEPLENDTENMDIGDFHSQTDCEDDEGSAAADESPQVVVVRNAKAAVRSVYITFGITQGAISKVAAAKAAKEAAEMAAAEMATAAKAAKDAAAREAANEAAAAKALAAATTRTHITKNAATTKTAVAATITKNAATTKTAVAAKAKKPREATAREAAAERAAAAKTAKDAAAAEKAAAAKAKKEAAANKAAATKAKKEAAEKVKVAKAAAAKETAAAKAAAVKAKKDAADAKAASAKETAAKTKAAQAKDAAALRAKAKTNSNPSDGPLPSRTIVKAGTLINYHDPDRVQAVNAIAPKIARKLEAALKKANAGCRAAVTGDNNETMRSNQAEVNRNVIDEDATMDFDNVRYTLYLDVSIDFFTGR